MFTCKAGGDFATTFVTEGVRTLWGYEPEDFLRSTRILGDRIHPEDVAAVYGHLARVLERGAHSYDYRFRTKSGEYRWTHDELRLVRDAAGNPLEIAGLLLRYHRTEACRSGPAGKRSAAEGHLQLHFGSAGAVPG